MISDFGGVLTNHLIEAFGAFQDETGISPEQLGRGMQRIGERDGEYPLFRLERGELSEREFLEDLSWALEQELGHRPHAAPVPRDLLRRPAPQRADARRDARSRATRGYRMAILTNNVREWEEVWRSKLPVDEIFELVVDSAWVGMRKPDPSDLPSSRSSGSAASPPSSTCSSTTTS